jgi:hypothetical protein
VEDKNMDAIGLSELVPQETKVMINGKEYLLKKISLRDDAWVSQITNGQHKSVAEAVKATDYVLMIKILYRLLVDKTDFVPKKIKETDLDGVEKEVLLKPYEAIMDLLSGPKDQMEILGAIMSCIGISRPKFNELVNDELKKKTE